MRAVLVVLVVSCLANTATADDSINAIVDDASWAGRTDAPETADEVTRIQRHLRFVHAMLSAREVSSNKRAVRTTALANLARYIERGVFPRRTDDPFEGRRPRFIDDRGVYCAVGQLIADSGDVDLAHSIDERHEYDYVLDMQEPALVAWADAHGFTTLELAMIQPKYRGAPTADSTKRMIENEREQMAIECGRDNETVETVSLVVSGGEDGVATATTSDSSSFARCVARIASHVERGGGAMRGRPTEYRFTMTLAFGLPQKSFEQRLSSFKGDRECIPRPGAIPRKAALEVTSDANGVHASVTTKPANRAVETCMQKRLETWFSMYGATTVKPLYARRELAITPRVTGVEQKASMIATQISPDCDATPEKGAKPKIAVTAQPDDERFSITVTGTAEYAKCMSEKLQIRLRDAYDVERERDDGGYVVYFRIDAPVAVETIIDRVSKADRDAALAKARQRANEIRRKAPFY